MYSLAREARVDGRVRRVVKLLHMPARQLMRQAGAAQTLTPFLRLAQRTAQATNPQPAVTMFLQRASAAAFEGALCGAAGHMTPFIPGVVGPARKFETQLVITARGADSSTGLNIPNKGVLA